MFVKNYDLFLQEIEVTRKAYGLMRLEPYRKPTQVDEARSLR